MSDAKSSPIGVALRGCVLVLILSGFVRLWFLEGWAIPCRVVGGSMAATLLGRHREIICGDCGYRFSCCSESRLPRRAVCPNCGYAENELEKLPELAADRVLIDRAAFMLRRPRRWEVAAFREPVQADRLVVKRVVGLPGETIEIRNGDVYADGRIQRKNLAQQRALAVLVHDADYEPTREPIPPSHWQPELLASGWKRSKGRFSHPANPSPKTTDWLLYRHRRRLPNGSGSEPAPVSDLCGYNQSHPRREEDVHPVTDLMLSFRLRQVAGRGALLIRATDGREEFKVRLIFDGKTPRCQVFHNGRELEIGRSEFSTAGERLIEASLVDQQFLLAIDGREMVVCPFDRSGLPPKPPSTPLAIGVRGIAATLGQLRVCRDVYYTRPMGVHAPGPIALACDEYYMLGDNSPVSKDSRNWPEGGAVNANLLIGKPLAAIPSVSIAGCGSWHFQVPNPAQIRYIQ